jgi:hypothetical protein
VPQKENKKSLRIDILKHLTLAPEARNEPSKGAYPAGRIKKLFDIIRGNFQPLITLNALTLIFALPLIAVILIFSMRSEAIQYFVAGIKDTPYFLSNFGIGLSSGFDLDKMRQAMLLSYRFLSLSAVVCLPVLAFGIAGLTHVSVKLIWGESFICKKDAKTGKDVPRFALEFFRGVKLYWKETVAALAVYSVILAGAANMIITFVGAFWAGSAGFLEYFGLIVSLLVFFFASLVLINYLPTVVSYKLKPADKLKNAILLSLSFTVPSVFILAVAAVPALALLGGFWATIIFVVMLTIGLSFDSLMIANYADYNAEKVLTPLYEMSEQETRKAQKTNRRDQGAGNREQIKPAKPAQNQNKPKQNQSKRPASYKKKKK